MRWTHHKFLPGLFAAALTSLVLACSQAPSEEPSKEPAEDVASLQEQNETYREDTGTPKMEIELPQEDPLAAREAEMADRERELAQREAEMARQERQVARQPAPAPAPVTPRYEPEPAPQPEPAPVEGATEPSYEAAPAPQPAPTPVTVATGTSFSARLATDLSSETSQVGDRFTARLTSPLTGEGREAVPAGSIVEGRVVEAVATKKIGGQARLGLVFDSVVLPDGSRVPLSASLTEVGKSQTKEDAAKIGGGALAGAILGRIIGGGSKAKRGAVGAVVGGAIGTVLAAKDEGDPIELPAGTVLTLSLEAPLTAMR